MKHWRWTARAPLIELWAIDRKLWWAIDRKLWKQRHPGVGTHRRAAVGTSTVLVLAGVSLVGLALFLVFDPFAEASATGASAIDSAAATTSKSVDRFSRSDSNSRSVEGPAEGDQPGSDGQYKVAIRPGPAAPQLDTGLTDFHGNPVYAACSTCHHTRTPNVESRQPADLNEFHQGLAVAHGNLTCLSCHHRDDYDSLTLADGTRVEYPDVMTLCAQCHGPQMRDYEHGAHGGMAGYWDLRRGPRQRNNCVDCHHPHSPAFPKMQPTFKPQDRFLSPESHSQQSHE